MFKTDKESLEKLSFAFNAGDIANLKNILNYLREEELLTISAEEAKRALYGLGEIGRLKLNNKVYAFHVDDSFANGRDGDKGVELYIRQGDILEEFYVTADRDSVRSVEDCIKYLKKKKIPEIYTGQIPYDSDFLGLPQECDDEDPLIRDILTDDEIKEFEKGEIKVFKLDSLI